MTNAQIRTALGIMSGRTKVSRDNARYLLEMLGSDMWGDISAEDVLSKAEEVVYQALSNKKEDLDP